METNDRSVLEAPPQATLDEVLKRLIVDELYWDSRVDASKVLVEVTDGVVTLTGHVPTVAERYSAEADARLIRGVVTVDNRLAIDRPGIVPDRELCENVTKVLNWTPDVDSSDIEVSVLEGVVTLRGTVHHYWEKLRAHLLASRIPGVVRVVDELAVTPVEAVSDRQIAHVLMQALERRLAEDAATIQVTVRNGAVTLRGSASPPVSRLAQETAEHTSGVVAVHNELISPQPPRPSVGFG